MSSPSAYVADKEINEVLSLIINKLNPDIQKDTALKKSLVDTLRETLKSELGGVKKDDLKDKSFVEKLFGVVSIVLNINKMDKPNPTNPSPLDLIKRLLKLTPEDKKKALTPEELKKKFDALTPKDQKVVLALAKAVQDLLKQANEKNKLPTPKPAKTPEDEMSNLLAVLNHRITGGHSVVVPVVRGNFAGFVDWSPDHQTSYAPLAAQDKYNDNAYGDSLGLNAATKTNLVEGGIVSDSTMEEVARAALGIKGPTPL